MLPHAALWLVGQGLDGGGRAHRACTGRRRRRNSSHSSHSSRRSRRRRRVVAVVAVVVVAATTTAASSSGRSRSSTGSGSKWFPTWHRPCRRPHAGRCFPFSLGLVGFNRALNQGLALRKRLESMEIQNPEFEVLLTAVLVDSER